MDHFELFQRLAVALGVGLLIGLERGWVGRDEPEGERALGLRTLGLSGLLGGVVGAVALLQPQAGGPLLAAAFLAFALLIAFFRYREMLADRTLGATTVVAALLVFALGVLAVMVDKGLAAAAGVAAAALLALKAVLHAFLQRLTWPELRAALTLLAMSVVLLPVLPDREVDPLHALNPHELWRMTILIAAVSSVGYVAIKLAGARWGVLLSALAGGLVSSTAVTLSLARLAPAHPERRRLLAAGILAANAVMLVRVIAIAALFNIGLIAWLGLPLLLAAVVLLAWCVGLHLSEARTAPGEPLALDNPFDVATVLKFGALLACVVLAAKAVTLLAGAAGAFAVAAASGIADVDAITLSMARLAGRELSMASAAGAILLAVAVNTLVKLVLAWSAGGEGIGRTLAAPLLVAVLAGAASLLLALAAAPAGGR